MLNGGFGFKANISLNYCQQSSFQRDVFLSAMSLANLDGSYSIKHALATADGVYFQTTAAATTKYCDLLKNKNDQSENTTWSPWWCLPETKRAQVLPPCNPS